jgi:DNA repair exonuclease SbcCD nuclease subunit
MKILFIGDMHLKVNNLMLVKAFLQWIHETVQTIKPDMVVNLGDTFHYHRVIYSEIVCEFDKHLKQVCENVDDYIYVLGNHDMVKPTDSSYNALIPFVGQKNFILVDERLDIDSNISFIPYIHEFKNFPTKVNDLCVAHQTFVGADYGMYRPDIGVDADALDAKQVISGHIHPYQAFGKVIYPGTPYAQEASDTNQDKGVLLWENGNTSFIESPFPKMRKLEVDANLGVLPPVNERDKFVINLIGTKASIKQILMDKKNLESISLSNVRINTRFTDSIKNEKAIDDVSNVGNILDRYINTIYSGSLNKNVLLKKLKEILNEN